MAGYNRTRYVEQLLEKTESLPPSFTVHLHPEYWVLNNGSKFLYHNQIASLLDDIRAQRIPVDFLELFDSARVPFYDGCMVVELLDYRPQRSKEPVLKVPEKTRVVLHPNSETLWADICLMNRRNGSQWSDRDALEVEAKILLATSQPLCLDPDPHLTRIVNSVLRMSTPTMPPSLKRKAAAMEPEEDGPEKARRSRILSFMAPQNNKSHMPSYRILDALSAFRLKGGEAGTGQASQASMAGHQYMNGVPRPPQSAPQPHSQPPISIPTPPVAIQGASPMDVDKTPQKADTTPLVAFNVPLPRTNGSNTPLPPPSTHQFVNQHPPPNHSVPNPNAMQPQVYPSVQAATEAAKKPATPVQQQQQHAQMQQYIQQHFQQQQQQQQQSHTQNQPRPPSQPQHPQQPQHLQQISPPQQQSQQHFTQSPKPSAQSNGTSPALTQSASQPFPAVQPTFQPTFPHSHFLQQPPPGGRNGPGTQPTNQQQALSFQQQQNATFFLQQQRMAAMAANVQRNATGGRATPQAQAQGSAQQLQQPIRRQTPQQQLQGQLAVARAASQSQSPHTPQAQIKQQTPQLANRTPQLQHRTPQLQFQQLQNQQSSPQAQAQAQALAQSQPQPQTQTHPQTQPQTQHQTQPQTQPQQQIPGHPHYAQYSYPQMPGAFWQQRSMQGMTTQQQLLLMQQAQQQAQQQQQQLQQSQQQQFQPQAQQQQVGQSIIVDSPQQSQGSVPVMTYGQKLAGQQQQQQQQTLANMNRMGGKGKVGQKKRGGGAGR